MAVTLQAGLMLPTPRSWSTASPSFSQEALGASRSLGSRVQERARKKERTAARRRQVAEQLAGRSASPAVHGLRVDLPAAARQQSVAEKLVVRRGRPAKRDVELSYLQGRAVKPATQRL